MYQSNSVLQLSDYRPQQKPLPVALMVTPETSATTITDSHPDASFFRMLESKNLYLNQQQISIITSQNRHMVINALAGTGKTSCIIAFATYLVSMEGAQPENILLLAYTKKSAQELQERIEGILPQSGVNASTFHSLCYRILRSNGYNQYKLLINDNTRIGIINSILRKQNYVNIFQADSLLALNSFQVNTLTKPNDGIIKSILDEYRLYKKEHKLFDFDDILLETYELLKHHKRLMDLLHHRFKYIIVDEIQDLNPLQYCILKQICHEDTVLYCFGDKHQSIFSFRGSLSNIMRTIKKDHPDTIEMNMNINYRCTASILGVANKVINTKTDPTAQLVAVQSGNKSPTFIRPKDSITEAKHIAAYINNAIRTGSRLYSDFAIIFRSSSAAVALFEELLVNNIPFTTSGTPETIYQHPIAKLIIAHLRLAINKKDLNSFEIILPSLYLSRMRIMQHFNTISLDNSDNLFDVLLWHPNLEDYQYDLIQRRNNLLNSLDTSPSYALQQLFGEQVIRKHLNVSGVSVEASDEVIVEIKNKLIEAAYHYLTIREFLSHIDEVMEKCEEHINNEAKSNTVNVMSIHSAKGLEYPVVFLIAAVENVLPHKNVVDAGNSLSAAYDNLACMNGSLDEEQRLLYVAVTRAKEELTISAPNQYNGYYSKISRFLEPFSEHFTQI